MNIIVVFFPNKQESHGLKEDITYNSINYSTPVN